MKKSALAPEHKPDKVDDAPLANDGVLPTDVLRDVLLRLPAKALCHRIRLVCRSWRLLTSDPVFVQAHKFLHPLIAGLHEDQREIHIIDLHGNTIIRRIPVPRACNDLTTQLDVVCASAIKEPSFVLEKGQREVSALPELQLVGDTTFFPSVLGYVPSTGEYKVLFFKLYCTNNHGHVQPCHVISLNGGNRRWRVAPRPAVPVEPAPGNRAVIGGVAYFLMNPYNVNCPDDLEPDSIASFDLEAEEWMPTPLRGPLSSLLSAGGDALSYKKHRHNFQLTELNGSLVIVHCKNRGRSMDIWFLMDIDKAKGIWCKRYSMQCASEWEYNRRFYPVIILDDGRIVMWNRIGQIMRAYDPRTSTWSTVMGTGGGMYVAVGTYVVGSLLL
ncbi:hypothetical protein SETIT_2G073300v2 [Setaria italica]|uniref:F-box domain-containing protein n=1 Tax=Setaria italica TaxID=4555 RepID=K4A374_SETIT|nr:hypothetical protein SETIT_2G073300v2 [Setaria italica]